MLINANAKINLLLDIEGKTEDNYHLMRMINSSIKLSDEIELNKIPQGIELSCSEKSLGTKESNIAYKAAKMMICSFKINGGISISIKKNIPIAAGLAGGSTDAAAVIKGINDLYDLGLSIDKLMQLGVKLGADVPYCIYGKTALCEGIGEKITPEDGLDSMIILLVKPPFGVSTKEVFQEYDLNIPDNDSQSFCIEKAIKQIKNNDKKNLFFSMGNVLEKITIKKHPVIVEIKKEMIEGGADISLMSGSGPSVFGIFDDKNKAQNCYIKLKARFKETYLTETI